MKSRDFTGNIRSGSEGSAIITVVVAMFFVIVLGAALLFTAYTAYTIRIAERDDSRNYYGAVAAMDDIRAGLQTQVTQAIARSYTNVLTEYTDEHPADYDPQEDFNNRFLTELSTIKIDKSDGTGAAALFVYHMDGDKTVITGYNHEGLKEFIDSQRRSSSAVSDGEVSESSPEDGQGSISLEGISLKYTGDNGAESDITTDITIMLPDFFAGSYVTSSINNSVLIADHGLIASGGSSVSLDGGIFIGEGGITLKDGGNDLALSGGDVICKGPVSIGNSDSLNFNASQNEFWAENIKLGSSSEALLNGKTYVANDLIFSGGNSAATLKNTYTGFGDSSSDSSKSSSIIVNARDCALNIDGLSKLSLAGVSFIDISNAGLSDNVDLSSSYKNPIMMGESLSVKSDQLAYLVPAGCITNFPTNPCVFPADATKEEYTPLIDTDTVLWGTGNNAKKLSDYIDESDIKPLYKNLDSETKIVYVFMVFSDKDAANAYFKDYFTADPSKIEQYHDLYLSLSDKDDASIETAGNAFYEENKSTADTGDDELTLIPASDSVYAAGSQLRYSKMASPYSSYVNISELSKLAGFSGPFKFSKDGNSVAVIATGDYTYDSDADPSGTVKLIISSEGKDVTINKNFKGVIISGNDITLKKSAEAALLDSDITEAVCQVGDTTYKLSDFIGSGANFGESIVTSKDAWDLDSLVFYENWTKN